ncbi:redoxin domain-containing protein [Fictibacillus phosphorivorans]|uniref:redoxin domain-containing protein n=1 Tax=Fictibacillus phosphorivorans TaxID=1221500 RepID=UPI001293D986|nr:TlpA disulfide reductase family protein [Fictibacillus phosphorivorans]MQR94953.1 redoxin domain-containing protein [Fictibacillus phosphorivorans]
MMTDYLTIGSFPVKMVWLAILGSALIAYGILFVKIRKEPDKKQLLDVLSNAAGIFLLVWKFSYAILHPLLIIKHPTSILYFNGGETGIVLGIIGSILYILGAASKRELDKSRVFYIGILGLTLYFAAYYGTHYASTTLLADGLVSLFFSILSLYLYTKGSFEIRKTVLSMLVTALFFSVLTNSPLGGQKTNKEALEAASYGIKKGDRAPNFELKTIEGETVKLSDLKGKVVFVNLWATWCPPCRAEMPEMVRFYRDHSSKKVEILAVNLTDSDSEKEVKKFAQAYKLNFPVLLDPDGKVGNTYKTVTIPTTFIINKKGIIEQKHIGPMSYDMMEEFYKNAQ